MPAANSLHDPLDQLVNREQCFPIVSGIFFVAMYSMCFSGLFSAKSELIAMGLLLTLSAMSAIYVYRASAGNTADERVYFLPSVIAADIRDKTESVFDMSWIGSARLAVVLIIGGGLNLAAICVLLSAYMKVRANAANGDSSLDFGNRRAQVTRLKQKLVMVSVMFWALYFSCTNRAHILSFMNIYLSPDFSRARAKKLSIEANSTKIEMFMSLASVALVVLAIACTHSAREVAKSVGSI